MSNLINLIALLASANPAAWLVLLTSIRAELEAGSDGHYSYQGTVTWEAVRQSLIDRLTDAGAKVEAMLRSKGWCHPSEEVRARLILAMLELWGSGARDCLMSSHWLDGTPYRVTIMDHVPEIAYLSPAGGEYIIGD